VSRFVLINKNNPNPPNNTNATHEGITAGFPTADNIVVGSNLSI
jgi:hypothetical protein